MVNYVSILARTEASLLRLKREFTKIIMSLTDGLMVKLRTCTDILSGPASCLCRALYLDIKGKKKHRSH